MTLKDIYDAFRKNPKTEDLSESSGTCSYITSGVYYENPEKTLQHFHSNLYEIETVQEEVIECHETSNSLVLETDSILKFVRGPGSMLPGLAMNFVADEQVHVYLVHIVKFDESQKIQSIKYTWDQSTLLKQLNVIGSRGNAWPIYPGRDQVLLAKGKPLVTTRPSTNSDENSFSALNSPMRGWPASRIFHNQGEPMAPPPVPKAAMEAPSPSAKPPHRTFHDITNMMTDDSIPRRPAARANNRRERPQSAYMSLFGGGESQEEYTRVIGGGNPNNPRQSNHARPSWAPS